MKIEDVKFIPNGYCPEGVVMCHPETSETIKVAIEGRGIPTTSLSSLPPPRPLPDCMMPDGSEGACKSYIEAQDRILYLENALAELEIYFKAQSSTPPPRTYEQGAEDVPDRPMPDSIDSEEIKWAKLQNDFEIGINRHSMESVCGNVPDFILAEVAVRALIAFAFATNRTQEWGSK